MGNIFMSLSQQLTLWGIKDTNAQGLLVFCAILATGLGIFSLLRVCIKKPQTIIFAALVGATIWFLA